MVSRSDRFVPKETPIRRSAFFDWDFERYRSGLVTPVNYLVTGRFASPAFREGSGTEAKAASDSFLRTEQTAERIFRISARSFGGEFLKLNCDRLGKNFLSGFRAAANLPFGSASIILVRR